VYASDLYRRTQSKAKEEDDKGFQLRSKALRPASIYNTVIA